MQTVIFEKITMYLIENLNIKPQVIVLGGGGFSSDYADKYT